MFKYNILTAVPAIGSVLAGWSGACAGTGPHCTVQVEGVSAVTATFNTARFALKVGLRRSGAGAGGAVTSQPAGIACAVPSTGGSCSAVLPARTVVQLYAQPAAGSFFTGWSGACSGLAEHCTVELSAATTVSASFTTARVLTVSAKGATGVPIGSSTGHGGIAGYRVTGLAPGTTAVLVAPPSWSGRAFGSWSGCDSVVGSTCTVSLAGSRSVRANYVR